MAVSKLTPIRSLEGVPCEPFACSQCGVYRLCLPLGLLEADHSLLESVVRRKVNYKSGASRSSGRGIGSSMSLPFAAAR